MLALKYVGDRMKILVTNLDIFVNKIKIRSSTYQNCLQHYVSNIIIEFIACSNEQSTFMALQKFLQLYTRIKQISYTPKKELYNFILGTKIYL